MSDKAKTTDDDKPGWWIYQGTGEYNERNRLSTNVISGLKQADTPPWRRFDPVAARQRGAKFIPELYEIERVNAALLLRRPLLVTGRPGTGKTSLTYAVAHELGLEPVLRWSITSRTTLHDGLYHYDAIARLQDIPQAGDRKGEKPPIGDYIKLGPLGTAFVGKEHEDEYYPRVLLIDEIDKSDIDLPNDLLHVFEEGEFEIPELKRQKEPIFQIEPWDDGPKAEIQQGKVQCRAFPIVVMTSNGEREFPPAFLRRCLQLEMHPPERDKLKRIVEARLGPTGAHNDKIEELLDRFLTNRDDKKKDLATDQFLNAVFLVLKDIDPLQGVRPLEDREALIEALWKSLSEEQIR
jgi:MoxR-like ATPase